MCLLTSEQVVAVGLSLRGLGLGMQLRVQLRLCLSLRSRQPHGLHLHTVSLPSVTTTLQVPHVESLLFSSHKLVCMHADHLVLSCS